MKETRTVGLGEADGERESTGRSKVLSIPATNDLLDPSPPSRAQHSRWHTLLVADGKSRRTLQGLKEQSGHYRCSSDPFA